MATTPFRSVTILRAIASEDIPEVEVKRGDQIYLARDTDTTDKGRFFVVRWKRIRWICSCGQGKCNHKLMVNDFLTEEFQKRLATEDDLGAHIENGLRSYRH